MSAAGSAEFLYRHPALLILVAVAAVLLLAGEAGHRMGRRRRAAEPDRVRAQIGNIQAALLGLFALLIGFTFAMALSRFDLRKELVVREANAIGTAALRARLLPAAQRSDRAELLRRYVALRVKTADAPNLATPEQRELDAESSGLHERLWQHAAGAAEADPRSVSAGLLVQAVNELIGVKGERDAALANHVPESVLLLLLVFGAMAVGVVGYGNGLADTRAQGATAILVVIVSLVVLVIVDLDRPRRGLIRVSQASMIELQTSLEAPK